MSNVSRSVYQTLKEENKRLLRDIYILAHPKYFLRPEKIEVLQKWRKKYAKDKEFADLMKAFAKQYFKDHPEHDIVNIIKKEKDLTDAKLDSNPKAFR